MSPGEAIVVLFLWLTMFVLFTALVWATWSVPATTGHVLLIVALFRTVIRSRERDR